ncbi:hypothetical protein GGX14DRAFT_440092 [Mycena pura]|uniref:CAP-Gly domain-containing protein n=1 Tax=Mycena pura TaxID=153505 RepID=A0AAD6VSF4_9AGAR|nr:hypothetical protein GGX14DRAFT_440092 [Mycena pura]
MKPRRSAIPTPGRSRSTSSANQPVPVPDVEYMSRAFADAIKANDPALHRTSRTSDISAATLSPQSSSFGPRPSSVASSSSLRQPERAKTPTSRPPSRQSDVFGKSTSRSGARALEVGDNVRIESLGYEGTLRYLGSIDGKPGLWAGVELAGGFASKGKNDGSVNGVQYFSCPPNCGVFVATTKLSPPTVGAGAVHRPSSVASSRGGRTTPSISGRNTPSSFSFSTSSRITPSASASTSRITPSNGGRVTPSHAGRAIPGTTPAARARTRVLVKTPSASPASLSDKLTAGSRASKYASMTAKQLSSRDAASTTFRRGLEPSSPGRSLPSPSPTTRTAPSPTRPPASPLSTPKPILGGRVSTGSSVRPSIGTPRARITSAAAMPPPASPVAPPISINEGSALTLVRASPRPESASSNRSTFHEERDQFQSRIEALEYENTRLPSASVPPDVDQDMLAHVNVLRSDHEDALSRISQLEVQLKVAEQALEERALQIQELESARAQALATLNEEKVQEDIRVKELQQRLEESMSLSKILTETISVKENAEREAAGNVTAKQAEIVSLELRLKRTQSELDEERAELGGQVNELRQAGQETIALYEERLSEADREKYDLEARIASLETRARATARTPSPTPSSKGASSATEIDNESLREQVLHLQKKVAKLEEALEEAHMASERDEAALGERMRRLKEREETMKKELNEGRREVERMTKSEASARKRVEEVEEALQESTVALEDARAEVEVFRTELTMTIAKEEITGLKHIVQELQKENLAATQRMKLLESENQLLLSETEQLRQEVQVLEENLDHSLLHEEKASDQTLPVNTASLQRLTRDQSAKFEMEIEQLRKRLADSEMKSARVAHNLNKEISELETLIESKAGNHASNIRWH